MARHRAAGLGLLDAIAYASLTPSEATRVNRRWRHKRRKHTPRRTVQGNLTDGKLDAGKLDDGILNDKPRMNDDRRIRDLGGRRRSKCHSGVTAWPSPFEKITAWPPVRDGHPGHSSIPSQQDISPSRSSLSSGTRRPCVSGRQWMNNGQMIIDWLAAVDNEAMHEANASLSVVAHSDNGANGWTAGADRPVNPCDSFSCVGKPTPARRIRYQPRRRNLDS